MGDLKDERRDILRDHDTLVHSKAFYMCVCVYRSYVSLSMYVCGGALTNGPGPRCTKDIGAVLELLDCAPLLSVPGKVERMRLPLMQWSSQYLAMDLPEYRCVTA